MFLSILSILFFNVCSTRAPDPDNERVGSFCGKVAEPSFAWQLQLAHVVHSFFLVRFSVPVDDSSAGLLDSDLLFAAAGFCRAGFFFLATVFVFFGAMMLSSSDESTEIGSVSGRLRFFDCILGLAGPFSSALILTELVLETSGGSVSVCSSSSSNISIVSIALHLVERCFSGFATSTMSNTFCGALVLLHVSFFLLCCSFGFRFEVGA
mmetsp:Transcript_31320/g.63099  ORF Transcript_31320/g.63099 Transcript_31320/m.63099 type:complete len:209 (+) Transcript_31320:1014-1640(+)